MIWSRLRPALRGPGRRSTGTLAATPSKSLPLLEESIATDAARHVVEVGPAGAQEIEPSFEVGRRQHPSLDLRRHVGDAPEVGRARSGDAFDHDDVAGPLELAPEPGPFGDADITGEVGQELDDGVVLRRAPAVEAGPVRGTRHDPALLADLEDHAQRVGHGESVLAAS